MDLVYYKTLMLWVCHRLGVILGLEYIDKGPNFMSSALALGNKVHVSARHFARTEAGTGREGSLNHAHPLSGMFVKPLEKGHPTPQLGPPSGCGCSRAVSGRILVPGNGPAGPSSVRIRW